MTNPKDSLCQECRVFTEYLLGSNPSDYVLRKYAEAHDVLSSLSNGSRFDDFLVSVARRHWVLAKMADSYARLFAAGGLLRRKLVLLLAILEIAPPFFRAIDSVDDGNKLFLLMRLVARGVASVISLALGTLLFLPAQLVLQNGGSGKK